MRLSSLLRRLAMAWPAAALLVLLQACHQACPPAPRLLILGDSTAAPLSREPSGHMGWGEALPALLNGVAVENKALPGASAKSFLAEAWPGIHAGLRPGDVVLVQFGQNDPAPDSRRHGEPYGAYREALARFVEDIRRGGGLPVLLTPLARYRFEDNRLQPVHGRYPDATRALAADLRIPLIDLGAWSEAELAKLGPAGARAWFLSEDGRMDGVHFGRTGAQAIALKIQASLAQLAGTHALVDRLLHPPSGAGATCAP